MKNVILKRQLEEQSNREMETVREVEELKLMVKSLEEAQDRAHVQEEYDLDERFGEQPIRDWARDVSVALDAKESRVSLANRPTPSKEPESLGAEKDIPEPAARPSSKALEKRKVLPDKELPQSTKAPKAATRSKQVTIRIPGDPPMAELGHDAQLDAYYAGWTEEERGAEYVLAAKDIMDEELRQVEIKMREAKRQLLEAENGNIEVRLRDGKLQDAFSDGVIMGKEVRKIFEKFNRHPKYFDCIPVREVDRSVFGAPESDVDDYYSEDGSEDGSEDAG